ncbi:MAG: OmpA family protein, partial [Desulfatirhabdiaceae bacterium]
MQKITAKRVLIVVIGISSLLMVGCAGMERKSANRGGPFYYHTELVQADRALEDARRAGKDKECPAEFNALRDRVDEAYKVYMACNTQQAIDMANEATRKIKALCPATPKAEMKPEPKPMVPAAKAEPKAMEKVIVLEDVHFDFDKSTLTKEAQMILKNHIQILKQNPTVKIRIQGNTSASGSDAYNQK